MQRLHGLLVIGAALVFLVGCAGRSEWRTVAPPPDLPELPREMRAAWVATVANIDWPSEPGLSEYAQRGQVLRILDRAQDLGLNTIVLQVRPAADAIYKSRYEPWSVYLSGEEGVGPGYDPLRYWIQEAHKRGIDVHAWFNPFRAGHPTKAEPASYKHVTRRRPEWTRAYGKYMWLDPGDPAAREHSLRVILDVVNRYDVDGVHLDDYFYPYPNPSEPFPDDTTYARYLEGGGTLDRESWRRLNINLFVREMYSRVKRSKPRVLVGISPFGIWRPDHPPGVEGFDAYARISSDSRLWLREGWLDYISPQLYWPLESEGQPFEPLLNWWSEQNVLGRHLWPGLYLSRVGQDLGSGAWEPSQIRRQVEVARSHPDSSGHIHFSMNGFVENRLDVVDELRATVYEAPAIPPAADWLAQPAPTAPLVEIERPDPGAILVRWRPYATGNDVRRWAVSHKVGDEWRTRILASDQRQVLLTHGLEPISFVVVRAIAPGGRSSEPRALVWVPPELPPEPVTPGFDEGGP